MRDNRYKNLHDPNSVPYFYFFFFVSLCEYVTVSYGEIVETSKIQKKT